MPQWINSQSPTWMKTSSFYLTMLLTANRKAYAAFLRSIASLQSVHGNWNDQLLTVPHVWRLFSRNEWKISQITSTQKQSHNSPSTFPFVSSRRTRDCKVAWHAIPHLVRRKHFSGFALLVYPTFHSEAKLLRRKIFKKWKNTERWIADSRKELRSSSVVPKNSRTSRPRCFCPSISER